jgi:diguanylate cyclase (GGDEF)-like protein
MAASGRWRELHPYAVGSAGALALLAQPGAYGMAGITPLALAFGAFFVFTIVLAFRVPGVGDNALDRTVHVAAILVLGTHAAALVTAAFGAVGIGWLLARRGAAARDAWRRAVHHAGMFALMSLAGGMAFEAADDGRAFDATAPDLLWRALLLIVVVQAVNEALFALHTAVEGGDPRATLSPPTAAFEFAAGWLGVLAAAVFQVAPPWAFAALVAFVAAAALAVRQLANTQAALTVQLDRLMAVNRVGRATASSTVLDEVGEHVFRECRRVFSFDAFYLVLYDAKRHELDFRIHHNQHGRQPRKTKRAGEGALGWIVENARPVIIEDWEGSDSEIKRISVIVGDPPASAIGVPLVFRARVLGVISLQSFTAGTYHQADLELLQTIADQVAVALANAHLFEALERQSLEDPLTGLANRRQFDARFADELARAQRFDHPLTVALLDIDHFKRVNDGCGHSVGDEVLRTVALLLRRECRAIDVVARHGGEEFVILLPETGLEGARVVCEKVRAAIERYAWAKLHVQLTVTASLGVFELAPGMDAGGALERADQLLYAAKQGGRNRVHG